jgi:hypothetical protein
VRWPTRCAGRLLPLSVLAAPIVVPPAVVISLALAVYTVVESAVTRLVPGAGRRVDRGMRL